MNGNLKPKLSMRYDKKTLRKFKKKNKIWGRIRKNLASEEEKLEHRKLSNQIRRLTIKSKKMFEKKIAKNAKSNPKGFYRYAQSKLKTRTSRIPDIIKIKTRDGEKT